MRGPAAVAILVTALCGVLLGIWHGFTSGEYPPEVVYAGRAEKVTVPRSSAVGLTISPKDADTKLVLVLRLRDVGGESLITGDPTESGYVTAGGERCPIKIWLRNRSTAPGVGRYVLLTLVPRDATEMRLHLQGRKEIPFVTPSSVSRRYRITEL